MVQSVQLVERPVKRNKYGNRKKENIQQRFDPLTPREHEIITFIISGIINKQIAAALNITEKTVKVHRARVFTKDRCWFLSRTCSPCREVGNQTGRDVLLIFL